MGGGGPSANAVHAVRWKVKYGASRWLSKQGPDLPCELISWVTGGISFNVLNCAVTGPVACPVAAAALRRCDSLDPLPRCSDSAVPLARGCRAVRRHLGWKQAPI
eukprot:scaffold28610_cov60-Phaeocystis_antarctica.AAC.4